MTIIKTIADLIQDFQAIIAVGIAVAGWLVTYSLSLRSQQTAFLNQVLNEARLDLTSSIREYEGWTSTVIGRLFGLETAQKIFENMALVNWDKEAIEFGKVLFDPRAHAWLAKLEEYEILFPETREARIELLSRDRDISERLNDLLTSLTDEPREREVHISLTSISKDRLHESLAFAEDIRLYLQNRCLGSITGNTVPERQPLGTGRERLAMSDDGQLSFVRT